MKHYMEHTIFRVTHLCGMNRVWICISITETLLTCSCLLVKIISIYTGGTESTRKMTRTITILDVIFI